MRIAGPTNLSMAYRCGTDPDQAALDNVVRHQSSTVDSRILAVPKGANSSLDFCFRVLNEQSLAHPKTFSFFEDYCNAIYVLDANTLHETRPGTQVTNATWAVHRATTMDFRSPRRTICYACIGVDEFMAVMDKRSPEEYLAACFEDFVPSDDVRAFDLSGHTVLNYVLRRLVSQQTWSGSPMLACLGNDGAAYRMLTSNIIDWNFSVPLVCTCF
jgi:hypothetical protein